MTARYAATRDELAELFSSWGEPRYRVAQLFDGLWVQRLPLDDITTTHRGRNRSRRAIPPPRRLPELLRLLAPRTTAGRQPLEHSPKTVAGRAIAGLGAGLKR